MLQMLQALWSWTKANPLVMTLIVWPTLTALVTAIFKPRNPDQYAALAADWPRVAAGLKLVSAIGIDPLKLIEAVKQIWSGTSKPAYTQMPAAAPKSPRIPPIIGSTLLAVWLFACNAFTKAVAQAGLDDVQCALANLDLPDDQIVRRCFDTKQLPQAEQDKVMLQVHQQRIARATIATQAHARGQLEAQHGGACAPDGGAK